MDLEKKIWAAFGAFLYCGYSCSWPHSVACLRSYRNTTGWTVCSPSFSSGPEHLPSP
ncbi:hypothetical protein RDI58_007760 [Solanum bulbocastanum]|uniref:Uncharacterized protein n=1 Tax=Solanum bulbocastanum TaxID=147425 RepID=A0AAN8YJ69_SOLBU